MPFWLCRCNGGSGLDLCGLGDNHIGRHRIGGVETQQQYAKDWKYRGKGDDAETRQ